jgi:arginase family enzyme
MTKQFRLVLSPLPDKSDPSGIRRLRRALKSLLRTYRLRCVDVVETAPSLELDNEEPKVSER